MLPALPVSGNALHLKRIIARMASEMTGVGQSAVEFDESSQANAVESRLSILRTLVEDVVRSSETDVTKDITVDGKLWRVRVSQIA